MEAFLCNLSFQTIADEHLIFTRLLDSILPLPLNMSGVTPTQNIVKEKKKKKKERKKERKGTHSRIKQHEVNITQSAFKKQNLMNSVQLVCYQR